MELPETCDPIGEWERAKDHGVGVVRFSDEGHTVAVAVEDVLLIAKGITA